MVAEMIEMMSATDCVTVKMTIPSVKATTSSVKATTSSVKLT